MSPELHPDEYQRLTRRKGFLEGILFVLEEAAHGTLARNRLAAERTQERVEWVLDRLLASDDAFSLHDLDDELPRLDGTRINDPLPVQGEHAGAPPALPGSGCCAGCAVVAPRTGRAPAGGHP